MLATSLSLAAWGAQALQITSFSPQGEVARVRQVVAKFDAAAVNFGDPKAPAPLALSCSDAGVTKGTGRWTGEREWVFDFERDLPPGVRCTATVRAGFKSAAGAELTGAKSYQFNSGGPFVQAIRPNPYQEIDEEQFFVLQLNGPATTASVQGNVWCTAEGVGERIPVRLIEGAQRAEILKALGLEKSAAQEPLQYAALACNRRFTSGSRMQVVFGKGVATPSGVANAVEKRFDFKVREPFSAEFSCERENAQAACLPIRPLQLSFNAPVPRKLAAAIRLKSPKETLQPRMEGAGDGQAGDALVNSVQFAAPLAENTAFTLELPKDLKDASGRPLRNADSFPLKVATGGMPPLAKFAAAPFGIVERFAEGPRSDKPPALLPVTLRNVEAALRVQGLQPGAEAPAGKVSTLKPRTDADIIAWFRKVQRYDNYVVNRKQARQDVSGPLPKALDEDKEYVQSRMLSLLAGKGGVKTLDLPRPSGNDPRPFEVVGIPLTPGFHVVEIASQKLGASLLDERHGDARTMYVRTSALVTNLGVHFKLGRENALAWVTTLDKGQPVQGATVRVSDCKGNELAQAISNDQGVANIEGLSSEPPRCGDAYHGGDGGQAYFVSARHKGDDGVEDMAFTWSDWQRGIEPWRFNVPTNSAPRPSERAHTIFDRTLFRAGETVSMKHVLRSETRQGFALPAQRPETLVITHVGSGQQFTQSLAWRATATGGLSAQSSFAVPPAAKLGVYQVELRSDSDNERSFSSGEFRVEEFRLPVLEGRIAPADKKALVRVRSVPTDVQVNYVAGGGAAHLPVRVSALVRGKSLQYADYEAFSFNPPRKRAQASSAGGDDEEPAASQDARVIADKLPLTLNKDGAGKLTIDNVPQAREPQELLMEATYADPNGEVQTLRGTHTLWPAGVVAGVKTEGWVSARQKIRYQALALQHDGKPAADTSLQVQAIARITTTTRKRMVGGFYSYDNQTETKDLGTLCSGKSDARGLLLCESRLDEPGEVELVVTATDRDGNTSVAASSVWVTRQGELWFGGEDHDRIDLLPEKKSYQPGETAKFQVRMPFRFATALVAVEREGVIDTQVVQLNGQDPTVSLKVQPDWGPNVYVSVLALRGRLREVPWYSFFTWGFKAPREWWTSFWYEGKEYQAPTALVDLSKPAFRLGLAEIRVGTQAHQISVKVAADKENYAVRGKAQVTITATLPGGKPAANAEVAVAAVDQALLELMPNNSWNLLEAMLQRRSWGVETSTAQMEIIGRRHYGKKAVPAGGGGGRAQTRELLDTLLLWEPALQLDANGQAKVTVPLNDALTTFKIVAVADASTGLFGTGSTSIRATQDLQIISGLPPLVREDDQFRAQITLRNTTKAAMKVEVAPRATLLELKPQTVDIPAGESREVAWNVTAPAQLAQTRSESILWEIEAKDTVSGARDALKARQRIIPAVPLTVQQATLVQVDGSFSLDVNPPADALPGRGGLKMSLQPKLAEGLPGVRDWWARYPFACLEQKTSKAVGLRDGALWQTVVAQLPTYLDSDGLANYFPPRDGDANRGSDTLTAYVLAATHEAASLNPAFALPDEARAPMERGLIAFVEGRIQRSFWSPRKDLDMRKVAALEALSRYGKAQGRMVGSITIAPNQWPTHTVIDWVNVLKRVADVPERDKRLAEALQILRSRLSFQGTKLIFSTEQDDYWWWLMQNGDVNTARLMLAVMDDPAWKDDMGRLANGFISRQQAGAWHTTTANLWGGLALEKFSARFEATPVSGTTKAAMGAHNAAVDWSKVERVKTTDLTGAAHQATWFGAPASPGNLKNNGMFLPWGTAGGKEPLAVTHQGPGKPWLTLQSVAAIQLKAPFAAGYSITKTVTPVEQANKALPPGQYTRGDVLRVTLEVNASADMTWVAITDPVPGGATILGSGLGRDSAIATQGEKAKSGAGWPAFEERSFEAFRSYYEYLPKGTVKMEYTVRLNNVGDFALPPSRVEAMYAPEMFGELPNARVKVEAAR
ncbi:MULTISPECIES: Ig-like domain-containing alpha-2-macroglobulin family protein [unclassified Acidovorax]|uniref:Ig-like domain-containing alpha-2-macroglobulin family protein n=1 Tax=unclassified Acidovorax TaxID=2684926 RepID=UPI001C48785A|nr:MULTISPECIES: Ig-like domain-containing alpha-2-macroglobulin family protein [unclassified Acidovorax]MBV7427537.1 alpha-2-macroglobulin [Acidovorax sp. sif0732]MBV7449897.1 alpha-2-macroglobulin [Acidovorax sp. sif0715]